MKSVLTEKDQLILKDFKDILLKSFPNEIIDIRVFGSRVRGEATSESDMDVLIVTRFAESIFSVLKISQTLLICRAESVLEK